VFTLDYNGRVDSKINRTDFFNASQFLRFLALDPLKMASSVYYDNINITLLQNATASHYILQQTYEINQHS